MKFEVLNFQGQVMETVEVMAFLPTAKIMESMAENMYKFRLDGKEISLKEAKALHKKRITNIGRDQHNRI